MRVLLIGGTGNLSGDTAHALYKAGHEVTIVSRGNNPIPKEYKSVIANRSDKDEMCQALAKCEVDVCINFLGFEVQHLRIDAAALGGKKLQQYIFISSATVYAKPHPIPLTENAPLGNEWSEYARKKLECEEWLSGHATEHGLPTVVVRPSHTFSCKWVPNLISSADFTFADRLIRKKPVFLADQGQSRWTLTTSRDFAKGLVGLVGALDAIGETFHITSDEVLTWKEIYDQVARAFGVTDAQIEHIPTEFVCKVAPVLSAKLLGDKVNDAIFDNSKIKRFVPNFQCDDSFQAGIDRVALYYLEHPENQQVNEETNRLWDDIIARWRLHTHSDQH